MRKLTFDFLPGGTDVKALLRAQASTDEADLRTIKRMATGRRDGNYVKKHMYTPTSDVNITVYATPALYKRLSETVLAKKAVLYNNGTLVAPALLGEQNTHRLVRLDKKLYVISLVHKDQSRPQDEEDEMEVAVDDAVPPPPPPAAGKRLRVASTEAPLPPPAAEAPTAAPAGKRPRVESAVELSALLERATHAGLATATASVSPIQLNPSTHAHVFPFALAAAHVKRTEEMRAHALEQAHGELTTRLSAEVVACIRAANEARLAGRLTEVLDRAHALAELLRQAQTRDAPDNWGAPTNVKQLREQVTVLALADRELASAKEEATKEKEATLGALASVVRTRGLDLSDAHVASDLTDKLAATINYAAYDTQSRHQRRCEHCKFAWYDMTCTACARCGDLDRLCRLHAYAQHVNILQADTLCQLVPRSQYVATKVDAEALDQEMARFNYGQCHCQQQQQEQVAEIDAMDFDLAAAGPDLDTFSFDGPADLLQL